MNTLRLVGIGIALWGLSWLWPEVNQVLTPVVMVGLILGLMAAGLAYALVRRLDLGDRHGTSGRDHSSHPMPAVVTR